MDGDGSLNMRNWGYYEPTTSLKGHLGLQLMSTVPEKPLLGGRNSAIMASANGAFHHRDSGFSQSQIPMDYMRDAWISQREKFLNVLPGNPNFGVLPEASRAHPSHPMHILQPPDSSKDERVAQVEEAVGEKESAPLKKRQGAKTQKSPKTKKAKRAPSAPKDDCSPSVQRAKPVKKNTGVVINGIDMDISGIPIPVCSCTGAPQQCYRWGSGGWQSACCTTGMSMYPLPMSTKRRGCKDSWKENEFGSI
ncbi:hypothetical protein L1049_028145 [Liquidambar formosana]|uniref:GAGA-binding transcriptional activator n=1 Tax=Liquidambar formosana TaxID=63359 RepID=A0AAP0WW51_LIQFO